MSWQLVTMWSVIWVSSAVVAIGTKDGPVMVLPAIGTLIWWLFK